MLSLVVAFDGVEVGVNADDPEILDAIVVRCGRMASRRPDVAESLPAVVHIKRLRRHYAVAVSGGQATEFSFEDAVEYFCHVVSERLVAARPDLLWFHAGAVAFHDSAVLIPGQRGAGKSTLVAALLDQAWTYLGDDVAPVDPLSLDVWPFPHQPRVRVESRTRLSSVDVVRLPKRCVPLADVPVSVSPVTLRGVVFPVFDEHVDAILNPLTPGETVVRLVAHLRTPRTRDGRQMSAVCAMARQIPAWSMAFRRGPIAAAAIAEQLTNDPLRCTSGHSSGGPTR